MYNHVFYFAKLQRPRQCWMRDDNQTRQSSAPWAGMAMCMENHVLLIGNMGMA
jgi:hypothetical protein